MTQQAWQYPEWIYAAQAKLKNIDLSKCPSRIWFEHQIISPDKNKYVNEWAICVNVKLDIKDRVDGYRTTLINPEGVYLYSLKNFEQIVYVEIERLMCHELKECFQIREGSNAPVLIFDPHNYKRPRIKMSTYDKVDLYRHHPSMKSWVFAAWAKKNKARLAKLRTSRTTKLANYCHKLGAWIARLMFEPKELVSHE